MNKSNPTGGNGNRPVPVLMIPLRRCGSHARPRDVCRRRTPFHRRGLRCALRPSTHAPRSWGARIVNHAVHRTRIKICGITRVADALAAADAGVDAIGLVFWPGTPRRVTIAKARAIVAALPPFVAKVGLFVDPSRDEVDAALAGVALDALQFHGQEEPELVTVVPGDQLDVPGRPGGQRRPRRDGQDLAVHHRRERCRSERDRTVAARSVSRAATRRDRGF